MLIACGSLEAVYLSKLKLGNFLERGDSGGANFFVNCEIRTLKFVRCTRRRYFVHQNMPESWSWIWCKTIASV